MKNIIHACMLALLASSVGLATPIDDLNKAYTLSYQTIVGNGLIFSGWKEGDKTKNLTACGLVAANEAYYSAAVSLSKMSGLISLDQNKLKTMEVNMQKAFDSFEDDDTKQGWYKLSSSFTRILSSNADDDYNSYHFVNGLRNTVALAENGCLEKYSKSPLAELNTALDEKGKLGNVKLGDTISNYVNYGGIDNYGSIVEDSTKAVLKNALDWYLTKTRYSSESYLGLNQFVSKSNLKWLGEQRFNEPAFRAEDIDVGSFKFHAPRAYISPSSRKVYAIEMSGNVSNAESKNLVDVLVKSYDKAMISGIWFSSTRILFLEENEIHEKRLLMIDMPLYLEHIKWVEAKRSKLDEADKNQKSAKKKEAENFFQ